MKIHTLVVRNSLCITLAVMGLSLSACKNDGMTLPGDNSGSTTPGQTPTPFKPDVKGYVDSIDQEGIVWGWSFADSNSDQSNTVALYVDGDTQTGTLVTSAVANEVRDDVNEHLSVTGQHGFKIQLPDSLKDHKDHQLHVYGQGANGLEEIGNSPFSFKVASMDARGYLDGIDQDGNAVGWAMVPELDTTSINVHFYIDGTPGTGTEIGLMTANFPRPDVNVNEGYAGDHGFTFKIPDSVKDGQTHQLFVFGEGPHGWTSLGNTPLDFKFDPPARHGIVRADGRNFVDDDGAFYPLGATVFWAMRGWKFDQERLKQNLQFLARHHYDYIRILGDVDWPGNNIDTNWSDYQDILAQLLDYTYNSLGMRVEITIMGGTLDPMLTAQKIVPVVQAGRQHMILDFEVANESFQRPVSLDRMREVGRYLRQSFPTNLVALSSVEGWNGYQPDATDWIAAFKDIYMRPDSANLATAHMDRDQGDDGWREVRQPWDFKDLSFPISHNEPIGPRSSVAEDADPVRLAMLRVTGIINGVGAFVLHNGSGVAGLVDPAHNRPANLWEVPDIDNIMDAVRNVDKWLPLRAGDGGHWNNAWAGNPWVADAFWGDGDNHGVDRNYTVATGDGWISVEDGVKDFVNLKSSNHAVVEIFDVIQGKVAEVELGAGQTYNLTPVSRDNHGYGAFIVIGHYR